MTVDAKQVRLECGECGWHTFCDGEDMRALLRNSGALRRATECTSDVLVELFLAHAPRMDCKSCDHVGLRAAPIAEGFRDGDLDRDDFGGDWNEVRLCRGCKKPIPDERLELFPDELICAACKERGVSADGPVEQEYCERCGGLMKMQQTRGAGISRYVMKCSDCGR